MTIGQLVTYHGKRYPVVGYATENGKVYLLWLDGISEAIRGKMLESVEM